MKLFLGTKNFFSNISVKNIKIIILIHIAVLFFSYSYLFWNFNQCNEQPEENLIKHNLYTITSNFFMLISEEKMLTEISLNLHDKKNLAKIESYTKASDNILNNLKKYCTLHNFGFIKSFCKSIDNIDANIKKIRNKSRIDLEREKSILNISDWSIFFNNQIEILNSLLAGLISGTRYSSIKQYTINILNILHKQFTLYRIVLEKNAEDIIDVFFSYSIEQVKTNIKSLENIITVNNIRELKEPFLKLSNIIDTFYKNIKNLAIVNESDFLTDIKEIKSFLKDVIAIELEYLMKNMPSKDFLIINKHSIIIYIIFLLITLLSLLCLLLIFYYRTLNTKVINNSNTFKTQVINTDMLLPSIKKETEPLNTEQYLFKKEVQFFISNAKNNIVKINEKLRVIALSINKTSSFGINNINNNSDKKFISVTEKITNYDFDNLELKYDSLVYKECINIFDKFQELAYRADIIKNIFIEIISELKVTYMALNIKNTHNNQDIIKKIDLLLKNIIDKSSEIKFYNNESKNTYKKAQEIISAIIEEHKDNSGKQKEFNNYIKSISIYMTQINKNFSAIYNHYNFIINSNDKLQNDIFFLKEHIDEVNKQISFIDAKVKKIFSK